MASALALSRLGLAIAWTGPRPHVGGPDVRTYALNAASVRLLTDLKVWDSLPVDARTAVYDMQVQGDAPAAAASFSAWSAGLAQLAWIVDAAELETALAAALRYAPHVTHVADGADAALQLLAEGHASAARDRLGVAMSVQPYGQRGLAARLRADQPHAGLARQWFRSPDILALLPFDRPAAGQSYGLVWSLPDERAAQLQQAEPAAFEAALAEATGGAAGTLTLAGERASWPLTLATAEAVCGPGWVLLGDAAHRVHPLAGQGLNLGLGDARTLARVLHERAAWRSVGDLRLLRSYERERKAALLPMGMAMDGLQQLFTRREGALAALRNWGMKGFERSGPLKAWVARQAMGAD